MPDKMLSMVKALNFFLKLKKMVMVLLLTLIQDAEKLYRLSI